MWNLKVVLLLVSTLAIAVQSATVPVDVDTKIVGGVDAAPNQIPYIASLRRVSNGNHFCGASIIRPTWVLSAAHCTEPANVLPNGMVVVVGSVLLSSGGVTHTVAQVINHEDYDRDLLTSDISLVQVEVPFTFNDAVQPILVGTQYISEAAGVVSGWGLTDADAEDVPNNLQTLNTRVITNQECRERHTQFHSFVHDNVICSMTQHGEGTCMGDSGGSLVVGNYVVGVPSWVIPCGVGWPDAYARVSSHADWIAEHAGPN